MHIPSTQANGGIKAAGHDKYVQLPSSLPAIYDLPLFLRARIKLFGCTFFKLTGIKYAQT